jgi:AraC-like DNA-binding protein
MRKQMKTSEQQTVRMQADREELAEWIARALPHDGHVEPRPGVHFRRHSKAGERVYGFYEPAFCVIAQGAKDIVLGDETFRYDASNYLISTMELPLMGEVAEGSTAAPYLSFRLILDPAVVTALMVELGVAQLRGDGVKAINVSALDANLLDATLRLVRLIDSPNEYLALAALVIREIIYRLLTGAQADRMRHLAMFGGQSHRMVRAVRKLREGFDKPLRIESIAQELGMSISGFHSHFKAVTAMSPLQFQKQIRLQEARRLMLGENLDAAQAGYRVGYDDPAYFSRDYKRHFGEPPMRDVERLRELAST